MEIQENLKNEYREYKLSRDTIQLVQARIININAKNVNTVKNGNDLPVKLRLGKKIIECSNKHGIGRVIALIDVTEPGNDKVNTTMQVECEGSFIFTDNLDVNEAKKRIDLQLIPQLLPYLRSAVGNISVMFGMPVMPLPTMDILKSIKNDKK